MLVDSHCHLDFPDFSTEIDDIVARARAADIGRIVTISTRVRRHAQVLAIAQRVPEAFCSVGTHPHYSHEETDIDAGRLIAISKHPKVVAIGEAGLDYFRNNSPREAQAQSFRQHIQAATAAGDVTEKWVGHLIQQGVPHGEVLGIQLIQIKAACIHVHPVIPHVGKVDYVVGRGRKLESVRPLLGVIRLAVA